MVACSGRPHTARDLCPRQESRRYLARLAGIATQSARSTCSGRTASRVPNPSADLPNIPHDALVRIEGLTHDSARAAVRSNVLVVGSHIVVAAPDGAKDHGQALPIVVGQVVDTSCRKGSLLVAWYLPQLARQENFRGGKKKQMIDVYGPWSPADEMASVDLKTCCLPDPIVHIHSVLEANFDLTEQQTLPYHVFDTLRNRHSIDLTGFSASMTRHGNLYRSYVLMRGFT